MDKRSLKTIEREFKESMSEMLNATRESRGKSFAATAYFSLTVDQLLRLNAKTTAKLVESKLWPPEEAHIYANIICTLVSELMDTFVNESAIEGEEVQEALDFGRTLFKRLEDFEAQVNERS